MPTPTTPTDLLTARTIVKRFGPTVALGGVTVSFRAGEVHALMGENGAGKSTLGKVIAGLHRQDEGVVTIDGRALVPGSIADAFDAGVRIVHQELAQCPNLSVAENLCLHSLPTGPLGLIDRPAMERRAAGLLAALEPSIDVRAPLGSLSPGHRQIVQIASALDEGHPKRAAAAAAAGTLVTPAHAARVIVFDEPTSSLSITEVERLLAIIRRLAAAGLTIIYVSHRMGEIFAACDRVTVLRDGRFVATSVVAEIDEPLLVEQMIGRRVDAPVRRAAPPSPGVPLTPPRHRPAAEANPITGGSGVSAAEAAALRGLAGVGPPHASPTSAPRPLLEVRGLDSPGKLRGVSLAVAPGEILGVGGLVGSGRSELLDALFGLDAAATGEVLVAGSPTPPGRAGGGARAAIRAGVGYVPEDRKLQGLFFQLGVAENIAVPVMPRLAAALGLRRPASEARHTGGRLRAFQVKAASPASLPAELSGGNQQKLLLARWMGEGTRVLLLDEPTRGIDVGTKAEIYRLVRAAADGGAAVLLVSSEMPELLALSDRLVVMCGGRLTGELRDGAMTQANILRLATVDG